MDWSQWLYIAVLSVALAAGRPGYGIAAVMLADLVGTMTFSGNAEYVGYIDLAAAAVLLGGNGRSAALAIIFTAMGLFEVIASRLHVANAIIYTGADVLAFLQCGVIGGADRGMGRFYRSIRGRFDYSGNPLAAGSNPALGLARVPETHGGGLNGRS